MKLILTILGLLFYSFTFGKSSNDSLKIIAQIGMGHVGNETNFIDLHIIKVIQGECSQDIIGLTYYGNSYRLKFGDTVLVKLIKYQVDSTIRYSFAETNIDSCINEVQISTVNFDYWKGCETGKRKCEPLTFIRKTQGQNWYLFMPCGGTATTVTLTASGQKKTVQQTSIGHSQCPPIFDLTSLTDGKYFAYMLACGLGRQIEINLTTKQ
jgi:hypothetical protein